MTHGEDGFGRGHTVVGDEDLADGAVASAIFDIVFDGFGGRGRGGGWIEGGGIEGGVGLGNVGWSEIDIVGEGASDGLSPVPPMLLPPVPPLLIVPLPSAPNVVMSSEPLNRLVLLGGVLAIVGSCL